MIIEQFFCRFHSLLLPRERGTRRKVCIRATQNLATPLSDLLFMDRPVYTSRFVTDDGGLHLFCVFVCAVVNRFRIWLHCSVGLEKQKRRVSIHLR